MELRDAVAGSTISMIEIALQRDEALELLDALGALLRSESPSHHEHVSSSDYQTEITVWLAPGDAANKEGASDLAEGTRGSDRHGAAG